MNTKILLFTIIFFVSQFSYSQSDALDPSFGNHGVVTPDLGKNRDNISLGRKVLVLPDGSMYIVFLTGSILGDPESRTYGITFISKRHPDGSADLSFGNKGITGGLYMAASDAALQADGKIVIAGSEPYNIPGFNVARYNTDGSLDSSFAEDGKLTAPVANSVVIQQDGKIIVAGGSVLFRYNYDGSADSTYHGAQGVGFSIEDITIQNDGKIVAAGSTFWYQSHMAVARFNTNGSLDQSFSDDGIYTGNDSATNDRATSVAIQNDGKIVIAGGSTPNYDNTYLQDITVWQFNADGTLDKSFSADGKQTTEVSNRSLHNSVTIQNDGKIVATGSYEVVRYNTDGSPDNSFSGDGKLTLQFNYEQESLSSVTILNNGKIMLSGSSFDHANNSYYAVARVNANGTQDKTFARNGVLEDQLRYGDTQFKSVAVQKDGKSVAAGVMFNGTSDDFAVVRYNADGSPDSSFSGDGKQNTDFNGANNGANAVAIQSDGKIVVIGYTCGDANCYSKIFAIVRYNADGSLDKTFSGDGKQTTDFGSGSEAKSIALQKDGKIVVAGYTYSYDSTKENFAIARFNIDGSLDNTFSGDGKKTTDYALRHDKAFAVAIQDDGKIVVGGSSGYSVENPNFAVFRYNADGSIDKTFSDDGIQTTSFNDTRNLIASIAIQKDGKIVGAGPISGYYENSVLGLVRYNTNGSLDNSFSGDGMQTTGELGEGAGYYPSFSASVAIQDDGKVIAAGNYSYNSNLNEGFALLRYNENGSPDSSFAANGIQKTNDYTVYGTAVSNNDLYAAGYQSSGLYYTHLGFIGRYKLIDTSKNNAPVVSITTPVNNQIIAGPAASVIIKATAIDNDGSITKVEFYSGDTLLHSETVFPYGYVWRNVPLGNYTLTAKAYDNSGNVTASAAVNLSVQPNKAPTVSITNPVNNQTIGGPLTIRLKADANDIDGTVTKVEFYNGATLLHTETQAPYTYTWTNVSVGNYAITAKATDNSGAETVSAVVNISVDLNKAPVVSITNPANGQGFMAPAIIRLIADAKDADGTISRVEFYNDTALISIQYESPYAASWINVLAGTYTITAKAIDNLGLSTVSAPVTVTVSNASVTSSKPYFKTDKTALNDALSLRLAPNPTNHIVSIYVTGLQQNKPASLSIISASGIVLKTMQINKSPTQLDVSSFVSGVYTLKIISGNKILYRQFVKL